MNIQIFDLDMKENVQSYSDALIVKMPLECMQMLSTCVRERLPNSKYLDQIYKSNNINHPCNVWLRQSWGNYHWLLRHSICLFEEFTYRRNKVHGSQRLVPIFEKILEEEVLPTIDVSDLHYMTDFARAVGEGYDHLDIVSAYRNYFVDQKFGDKEKSKYVNWKWGRSEPTWFTDLVNKKIEEKLNFSLDI